MPLSNRGRRVAVPLLAFLFGLAVLGVAALLTLGPQGRQAAASGVGGPFALADQDGHPVTDRDLRGRPFLVFFGFTHCPDVCPTTLHQVSEIFRAAGPAAQGMRALFVTVDPERDTPQVLKSYLASFDERITGLTGAPRQVEDMVRAYKAHARKVPTQAGDYTMEHTSLIYLMDKRGEFVGSFNINRPPEQAAAELRRHL